MDPAIDQTIVAPPWLVALAFCAVCASMAIWANIAVRWRRGLPVLPRQPRRNVPWRAGDVLMALLIYVAMLTLAVGVGQLVVGGAPQATTHGNSSAEHIVQKLLREGSWPVLLVCGLAACVAAPITEEFFFRLVLQGWLESAQRRMRRRMPLLRRLVPGAIGPIVLTSFLFGRMHFRLAGPMPPLEFVVFMLALNAVASMAAMGLTIVWLRLRVRATVADLGWAAEKFWADVRLGGIAFAALAPPLYAIQVGLQAAMPQDVAPDPITLFLFALALGGLYYRTHRLTPAIVLHMALNLTSLAAALAVLGS